jgi:hypothetical protein
MSSEGEGQEGSGGTRRRAELSGEEWPPPKEDAMSLSHEEGGGATLSRVEGAALKGKCEGR